VVSSSSSRGKLLRSLASASSGICTVWPNREKLRAWMLGCLSRVIVPLMVVTFDSKQLSQMPLIESINLEYISVGNCPALRAVQEDG